MNHDPVTDYAYRVLDGEYPACRYVKQACQRHLNDLERDDLYFDQDQMWSVFDFYSMCPHIEGDLADQPIVLQPPQQFILGSIFGWTYRKTGLRKYQAAYNELPRKNGKSTLLAPAGLYMLGPDGEAGSQVYTAATKEKQAKIVWGLAKKMVDKSNALRTYFKTQHNSILCKETDGKFEPLGADSETQDGWNPHAMICDELHQWKGRDYWDVLEDGFGARSQPLMLVITTAGHDRNGICYEQRKHCLQVLDPESGIDDDHYFAYIATVDEEDMEVEGWEYDVKNWYKANPMLGSAKRMDKMEGYAAKAKSMVGKRNSFINKQLDVWTDGETLWLDMQKWDAGKSEIDWDVLKGQPCYGGIDLSSTTDITALVLVFPPGIFDRWAIKPYFYMPEDNIREAKKRDKVPYDLWAEQGLIQLTPGDVIDLDWIKKDFIKAAEMYLVKDTGYDPWKGTELATSLENQGATMTLMQQGHRSLLPGTLAIETKLRRGELMHDGNPVLRWMASNTTTRPDVNDNHIPDKKNSFSRIDGISATVNAMGRAIAAGADKRSVYEDRGILTI